MAVTGWSIQNDGNPEGRVLYDAVDERYELFSPDWLQQHSTSDLLAKMIEIDYASLLHTASVIASLERRIIALEQALASFGKL